MPEGRVRKAKKPRWQLVLGLRQVICGALGVTWMMMIIFILGVLAGRGDIYRWLSSWGLITPESSKVAQWSPPAEAPTTAAPGQSPQAAPAAAVTSAAQQPAPSTSAAPPTPVTGSIALAPSPASPASPAKKEKAKKGASFRDQKAKEEELRRLRREVAGKLKFQNSFDSKPPKPAHTAQKQKEKAASPKTQVRVAQYRDLKAAKAKVAQLQKKGEKVSLKQGKDNKGVFYDIVREAPANPQPAAALAQKNQKPSGNKPKKPAGAGN